MPFDISVDVGGETYILNVKANDARIRGALRTKIDISVVISVEVAGEEYPADDLDLTYIPATQAFQCRSELGGLNERLYYAIVEKLKENYGYSWGHAGR